MVSPTTQKLAIALITLIVLLVFGYNSLAKGQPTPSGSVSLGNSEIVGEDILTLVEKLKTISLDQSLFTSPLFMSLKDYSVTLYPESQGRANPFAGIGI